MPLDRNKNQYEADVRKMRSAVASKLRQVVKLLVDINDIVDDVDSKYEYADAFNDNLPIDSYPFPQSFDELPRDIASWADDIEEMND